MKLQHPYTWLSASKRKSAFVVLFLLTIAVMVGMQVLGAPLSTDAAPGGIVTFEFAGDLATAQTILESWRENGRVHAGLNLGLDYLFLFAYAGAISLGCVLVAEGLSQRAILLSLVGVVLAWVQYVAALLDAVENYALIRVLLGSGREIWPTVAQWCAGPKFVIVALGLLYFLLGGTATLLGRMRQ